MLDRVIRPNFPEELAELVEIEAVFSKTKRIVHCRVAVPGGTEFDHPRAHRAGMTCRENRSESVWVSPSFHRSLSMSFYSFIDFTN